MSVEHYHELKPGDELIVLTKDGNAGKGIFVCFQKILDTKHVALVLSDPGNIGNYTYIPWELVISFNVRSKPTA